MAKIASFAIRGTFSQIAVPPSCRPAPHATRPQDHLRQQIADQQQHLPRRAQLRTPQSPAGHRSHDRRHRRRTSLRTATARPSGQARPRRARPQSHGARERTHPEPHQPLSVRATRSTRRSPPREHANTYSKMKPLPDEGRLRAALDELRTPPLPDEPRDAGWRPIAADDDLEVCQCSGSRLTARQHRPILVAAEVLADHKPP